MFSVIVLKSAVTDGISDGFRETRVYVGGETQTKDRKVIDTKEFNSLSEEFTARDFYVYDVCGYVGEPRSVGEAEGRAGTVKGPATGRGCTLPYLFPSHSWFQPPT